MSSADGAQRVVILGDFADPFSYLASQRVEQLGSLGLFDVDWRAVQADRLHPVGGRALAAQIAAALAAEARPGEHVPAAGLVVPNSAAATAAYAESLTDGAGDRMRRALYDAIWIRHQQADDIEVVRRIAFTVLNPEPIADIHDRIAANRVVVPLGAPDPLEVTRRMGYLAALGRSPLTGDGWHRVRDWRALWQAHGCPRLPLLLLPGDALAGPAALRWLARRLPQGEPEIVERVAVPAPRAACPPPAPMDSWTPPTDPTATATATAKEAL